MSVSPESNCPALQRVNDMSTDNVTPRYRKAREEVGAYISAYQKQVTVHTKHVVEKVVSERLKVFVPETLEQGIKGVQEFIAEALDIARNEMDGAIDALVPLPFTKRKFSYFDVGVVTATKNEEVMEFFYSYYISHITGEGVGGYTKTEYYKVDKRYWGVQNEKA